MQNLPKEEWNLQDNGNNWKMIWNEVTQVQKKQMLHILLLVGGGYLRVFGVYVSHGARVEQGHCLQAMVSTFREWN